jgi:hypothetical protein
MVTSAASGNTLTQKVRLQAFRHPDALSPRDGHAVLWKKDGSMIDLNVFVPPGTDLTLLEPGYINDRGEIVGKGPRANGDTRTFVLIPCGEGEPGCIDAATAPVVKRPAVRELASKRAPVAPWRNRGFLFPTLGSRN